MTHLRDDDFARRYYGETPEADRERVDAHLASCGACRATLEELRAVLALVDSVPGGEPGEGFEREAWARLEPRLVAERGRRRWLMFGAPVRWAAAGAIAATLLGAFLAGWLARGGASEVAPAIVDAEPMPVRERVLLVAVGDHLERSQMVLVELMNADETATAGLAAEREHAADLVAANRLYRQTAAAVGDEALGDVLGDLERVLLEVANGPAELAGARLEALRERIEGRGILFRVRVMSSEVRAREQREIEGGPAGTAAPVSEVLRPLRGSPS